MFAVIAKEEGLSDEEIMDLTPARIIQKFRTLIEIQADEREFQLQLAEMQTKTLAAFMAQSKEAAAAVSQISFTGKRVTQETPVASGGPPGTAEKLLGLLGGGV